MVVTLEKELPWRSDLFIVMNKKIPSLLYSFNQAFGQNKKIGLRAVWLIKLDTSQLDAGWVRFPMRLREQTGEESTG